MVVAVAFMWCFRVATNPSCFCWSSLVWEIVLLFLIEAWEYELCFRVWVMGVFFCGDVFFGVLVFFLCIWCVFGCSCIGLGVLYFFVVGLRCAMCVLSFFGSQLIFFGFALLC